MYNYNYRVSLIFGIAFILILCILLSTAAYS